MYGNFLAAPSQVWRTVAAQRQTVHKLLDLLLLLLRVAVAALVLGTEVEAQPTILAVRLRTPAPGLADRWWRRWRGWRRW